MPTVRRIPLHSLPAAPTLMARAEYFTRENVIRFSGLLLALFVVNAAGCGWQCTLDCTFADGFTSPATGEACKQGDAVGLALFYCGGSGGTPGPPGSEVCVPISKEGCIVP